MSKFSLKKLVLFFPMICIILLSSCSKEAFPSGKWIDQGSSSETVWEFKSDGKLIIYDKSTAVTNVDEGTYSIKNSELTISGITFLNGGEKITYYFESNDKNSTITILLDTDSKTSSNSIVLAKG